MTISKTANLVIIPTPGMGHVVLAVELAKHLVARDPRLSIPVILIKLPLAIPDVKLDSYTLSVKSNSFILDQGIRFIDILPMDDIQRFDPTSSILSFLIPYMEACRPTIKNTVKELGVAGGPVPVAGIVVDMFSTAMIDVAAELGLLSYVFFSAGTGLLRLMLYLQGSRVGGVSEDYDIVQYPDTRLEIPGFKNQVPVRVWPGSLVAKGGGSGNLLCHAERYRRTKGILVNTFSELEQHLIHSLMSTSQDNRIPPIYTVGPILNLPAEDDDYNESSPTMRWLEGQPPRSVAFLCFGSRGSFNDTQIKEIADGLERSGQRFLWSLRTDDPSKVLPVGFLERTAEQGRVIGWAPQARVLAHEAVGAFVSHCGWNSTLESIWYGVPMAAWPIYAEQQLNAFALVKELGLATEIRIDYRQDFGIKIVLKAEEVEAGICKAMKETEVRKKVEEMCDMARKALEEGGSSYQSFGRFIDGVFKNLPSSKTRDGTSIKF